MRVHKKDGADSTTARCGYRFQKHLRGLDACATWNKTVAVPVDCPDCILFHRPVNRKIATWEQVGKKVKF